MKLKDIKATNVDFLNLQLTPFKSGSSDGDYTKMKKLTGK